MRLGTKDLAGQILPKSDYFRIEIYEVTKSLICSDERQNQTILGLKSSQRPV